MLDKTVGQHGLILSVLHFNLNYNWRFIILALNVINKSKSRKKSHVLTKIWIENEKETTEKSFKEIRQIDKIFVFFLFIEIYD